MAEDIGSAVKAVLAQKRAALRAAEAPPPAPPQLPAVVEPPRSVAELRAAVQREYLDLLLKPEVKAAVERQLRAKDTKAAREMFAEVVTLVADKEKAPVGGPRITFVSKIARERSEKVIEVKAERT